MDPVQLRDNIRDHFNRDELDDLCFTYLAKYGVRYDDLPVLPHARELIEAGFQTGASARNWASYGDRVNATVRPENTAKTLLTDPQTSGGLLVACSPDTVTEVLSLFLQQGFSHVSVIGEIAEGEPGIDVV